MAELCPGCSRPVDPDALDTCVCPEGDERLIAGLEADLAREREARERAERDYWTLFHNFARAQGENQAKINQALARAEKAEAEWDEKGEDLAGHAMLLEERERDLADAVEALEAFFEAGFPSELDPRSGREYWDARKKAHILLNRLEGK